MVGERALAAAWRQVDRGLDNPNDPVQLNYITEAEIRTIEAHARRYLGQHDKAVTIYHDSVTSGSHPPRDEASYRAYYAASLARLGDTTSAVDEGLAALTMLEGPVQSPRLVNELRPVHLAAAQSRSDDANQFRSRFDSLVTAA
ncbi:hypothetical protein ABZV58_28800 [Nocardia sp. NPDC004654]|uniref:hypothetical protein n=1 Tax=Nocardia sp. NPDC004654 TaxID=3154776 RepID=UPI0033BA5CC8